MRCLNNLCFVAVVSGLIWTATSWAEDPAPPGKSVLPERTGQAEATEPSTEGLAENRSPLWIGVVCHTATAALRAQLQLPDAQGLVVSDVAVESPAAAAGIRRHDVLLKADDQNLSAATDLIDYIQRRGQQVVTLELLRGGERVTVKVTPVQRPPNQRGAIFVPGADRQALREFIERLDPNIDVPLRRRRLRLRFLHPGLILESRPEDRPWPADLSVGINREGNQPLKITVRRGDESWEIDREQMGKLPEMIRPFVQGMLGDVTGQQGQDGDLEIDVPDVQLPGFDLPDVQLPEAGDLPPPAADAEPAEPGRQPDLRERLEAIQRQLEQLRDSLQDVQAAEDAGK
ncbi:MAG: PDZ domain-containing protein [Planctomycetota bacterium]|nr:PDZ domain-containing protein [Planctomycetota bacterium]